jgi:hypothetical protein
MLLLKTGYEKKFVKRSKNVGSKFKIRAENGVESGYEGQKTDIRKKKDEIQEIL